jgi:hypothetical protein
MAASLEKAKTREYLDKWAREVSALRKEVCMLHMLPKDRYKLHLIASAMADLCNETNRAGFFDLYEEALKAECLVFDAELETAPGEVISTYPILCSLDALRKKIMTSDEEICWRSAQPPHTSPEILTGTLETPGLI